MSEKKIPLRMCVGCRAMKPKKELIRVVTNGEGTHIDRSGKANGRGAYICSDVACLKKAVKSKAFPAEVLEQLKTELEEAT